MIHLAPDTAHLADGIILVHHEPLDGARFGVVCFLKLFPAQMASDTLSIASAESFRARELAIQPRPLSRRHIGRSARGEVSVWSSTH